MSEELYEPRLPTASTNPVQVAAVSSATFPPQNQVDEEFIVEQILDKRSDNGQIHYLVKWYGYSHQENTWEHEDFLSNCPVVLEEFHRRHPNLRNLPRQGMNPMNPIAMEYHPMNVNTGPGDFYGMSGTPMHPNGFARGYQAQKIVGMRFCGGELCYLINWHGSTAVSLVPAQVARVWCPQVVINFYEENIKWSERRTRQGPWPMANAE